MQEGLGLAESDKINIFLLAQDGSADNGADLVLIFIKNDIPLRFAHFLEEHLLGSLSGDATEVLQLYREIDGVADCLIRVFGMRNLMSRSATSSTIVLVSKIEIEQVFGSIVGEHSPVGEFLPRSGQKSAFEHFDQCVASDALSLLI